MTKSINQIRHEKLIEFLSQFSQYQDENGKPTINKVKDVRTSGLIPTIDTNDINKGAVVLTDFLNLYSGSVGNFDLYRLLQAYLTLPDSRDQINKIVDQSISNSYK